MAYLLLLLVHLLAAMAFAGTVLFEVLFLPGVRRRLPAAAGLRLEAAFAERARRIMPWVLLALYAAGLGLAWHHRGALARPLDSAFALLLVVKIALAASVFGHFLWAMVQQRRGRLDGPRSRRLHRSVLLHVLAIVVLAKAMFHL
ncbi:membrane protein [Pseudoxanthomonas suwonensis]|uniref:Membrane protein n=2 Tax=Pseudoxanthomonas suwonensis TaxID=314722 RepID=A0A0E3Z357_9GAMM|nr:membrane protein [Pseudoxanthomonas suwonensis]